MSKIDKITKTFQIEKVDNGFFTLKKPLPLNEVFEKISTIEDGEQHIFPYEVGGYVLWLLIK